MAALTAPLRTMRSSDVNRVLEFLVMAAILTGIGGWMVGTAWGRALTFAHATIGIGLLVLAPAKLRGSVRRGMRRGGPERWASVGFGLLVVATVVLGVVHSAGLWFGVGTWSALWTHTLAAFLSVPFFLWHLWSRPVAPSASVDAGRRRLIGGSATLVAGAAVAGAQEITVRVAGLAGADRRFTGSHEVGSFDPAEMPRVSWLDDSAPTLDRATHTVAVAGRPTTVDELWAETDEVVAVLDCTGGWWSEQRWNAVSLARLDDGRLGSGRSVKVTSATGYARWFSVSELEHLHLAVGYDGEPLRRGHGAPVRLVAPGRRGPWWVKWVVSVEPSDRPAWLQLPFPPT